MHTVGLQHGPHVTSLQQLVPSLQQQPPTRTSAPQPPQQCAWPGPHHMMMPTAPGVVPGQQHHQEAPAAARGYGQHPPATGSMPLPPPHPSSCCHAEQLVSNHAYVHPHNCMTAS